VNSLAIVCTPAIAGGVLLIVMLFRAITPDREFSQDVVEIYHILAERLQGEPLLVRIVKLGFLLSWQVGFFTALYLYFELRGKRRTPK